MLDKLLDWFFLPPKTSVNRRCVHEVDGVEPGANKNLWAVASEETEDEVWKEHNAVFVKHAHMKRVYVCVECGEVVSRTETDRLSGNETVALKSQMDDEQEIDFRLKDDGVAGFVNNDNGETTSAD